MDFLLATVVFPGVVAALGLGAGLLVERASGTRLPGPLLIPLGLGGLIGVGLFFTWQSSLAPVAAPVMWLVGVAGLVVGWRRLRGARIDRWAVAATVVAYLVLCAPVLMAGRPTFAGYLLDTTGGVQMVGAELLFESGKDYSGVPPSSLRGTLDGYFGREYPVGGHLLLGGLGRPFPTPLMWLYQPLLALLAAMCAPTAYFLLRRLAARAWLAALGGTTSAMPALVYAYVQQGSIKEVTVLPFLLLLAAMLVLARELWSSGPRGTIPFAVVGAGGVGAIGLAFGAWLGLAAVAALALVFLVHPRVAPEPRGILVRLAIPAVLLAVMVVPALSSFADALAIGNSFDQDNAQAVADPGNLLRPLLAEQATGVWLQGTHRLDPGRYLQETYMLIGVVGVAVLLGLGLLVRRRQYALGGFVVISLVVWFVLTQKGTTWTDAKLLTISSPVVILLAFAGASSLSGRGFRIAGAALAVVVAGGVLLSNALTYHDTNLAPTARFDELMEIGDRFAGRGPTLVPDFDEYAFYALDEIAPDGPGFAFRTQRTQFLADGGLPAYGISYDLDALPAEQVRAFPLIVMRRSPERSRPPSGFERVFEGDYYEVWARHGRPEVLTHLVGGGDHRAYSSIACRKLGRAARRAARIGGELHYAERGRSFVFNPVRSGRPPAWAPLTEGIALSGPGVLRKLIRVRPPGPYLLWFMGDFGRAVKVFVDGREVGQVAYETGGDRNYAEAIRVELDRGWRQLELRRGGGSLRPGDAVPSRLLTIVAEPAGAGREVGSMPPGRWRTLCGRNLDWVEVVSS